MDGGKGRSFCLTSPKEARQCTDEILSRQPAVVIPATNPDRDAAQIANLPVRSTLNRQISQCRDFIPAELGGSASIRNEKAPAASVIDAAGAQSEVN